MTTAYLTLIGPPAIALVVSGWLRDAKLPGWVDTLIALLVVLGTAWIWALIAGKLVGDLAVDTLIIAGYVAALLAGPMVALHEWLVDVIPSPVSTIAEALSHYAPTPIDEPTASFSCRPTLPKLTLPTTPDLVARSSLLEGGSWRPTVAAPVVAEPVPPSVEQRLYTKLDPLGTITATTSGFVPIVSPPPPPNQGNPGVPPTTP